MIFHQIHRRVAANRFGGGDIAFRVNVHWAEISFVEDEEVGIQVVAEFGKLELRPMINQIQVELGRTADAFQPELRLERNRGPCITFQHRADREIGNHAFAFHAGFTEPFDQERSFPQMHIA